MMWQFDIQSTEQNVDQDELNQVLDGFASCDAAGILFDKTKAISAARAPGRLDVMGGIADYSGSAVLQLPLAESVWAFCQLNYSGNVTVVSELAQSIDTANTDEAPRVFRSSINQILDYSLAYQKTQTTWQDYFTQSAVNSDNEQGNAGPLNTEWAAYIVGALPVLMQEYNFQMAQGLSLYLFSSVPEAKGVSSSAAIELASMRAITHALQLEVSAEQQAVLAQRVENTIVGAACGIMDQMTSSIGRKNQLLCLLCQPHNVLGHIEIPNDIACWGIDSGLRHHVSGADYTSVRVATFMGYRIVMKLAGIAEAQVPAIKINDTRLHGYLANMNVDEFNRNYLWQLPSTLTGKDFLNQYCDHVDTVTTINEQQHYAVRTCTAHPVNEHFRVNAFTALLRSLALSDSSENNPENMPTKHDHNFNSRTHVLEQLGEYMYQSHAGYTACGLNSSGTDELVSMLRDAGTKEQIYGARVTGGGSGGTVVVLTGPDADETVSLIAARYKRKTGLGGFVFSSSSQGAFSFELQPRIA